MRNLDPPRRKNNGVDDLYSYLYQLVEQLNFILNDINKTVDKINVADKTAEEQSKEIMPYIESNIFQSLRMRAEGTTNRYEIYVNASGNLATRLIQ